MDCVFCGAELRTNARYCNHCGSAQPAEAPMSASSMPPLSSVQSSPSPGPSADIETASAQTGEAVYGDSEEADNSGRTKRPPRVLRVQYQPDQEGVSSSTRATDEGVMLADRADKPVLGKLRESLGEGRAAPGNVEMEINDEVETQPSPTVRVSRPTVPQGIQPVAWADTETAETEILAVPVATTGKLDRLDMFSNGGASMHWISVQRVRFPT